MKSVKRVFLALASGLAFLMLTSELALAAGPKKRDRGEGFPARTAMA